MAPEDPGAAQAGLSSPSLDKPQVHEPPRCLPKRIQLDVSSKPDRPCGPGSSIQLRSYPQTPYRSYRSSGAATPSSHWPPRASVSSVNLQHLLEKLELDQYDTYGVEEHRDGFFDATFFRPLHGRADLVPSVPVKSLFSHLSGVAHDMIADVKHFLWTVFTTHQGINVAKSLLSYLLCYYLCLIPSAQRWLGVHSYFAVISVLLNHSGRSFGAQLDGLMLCTVGAAVGMIWGCLALEFVHQINYTEIRELLLGLFLVTFAIIMAGLRSTLVRLYQALMSAGLAVIFMCLVSTHGGNWDKNKISEFAVPFLAGQLICLVVNIVIFPETGGRGVAVALHNTLLLSIKSLQLPREPTLDSHRNLNMQLVNLSEAFRDMRMEVIITGFIPDDIRQLRNTLQTIIRDLMAIDPATTLFDAPTPPISIHSLPPSREDGNAHIIVDIDTPAHEQPNPFSEAQLSALKLVRSTLASPARALSHTMGQALEICDVELMKIGGYHDSSTGSGINRDLSLPMAHDQLRASIEAFDVSDSSLNNHILPHSYSKNPELVQIFLFIHPLRQAAGAIMDLVQQVVHISSAQNAKHMKCFFPSYPWKKSLYRTSPQVLHDRGGVTANIYFRSKTELDGMLQMGKQDNLAPIEKISGSAIAHEHTTTRYRIWKVIHRLQGFEARFAIKMAVVTTLLSLPMCLDVSQKWYNNPAGWWSVMTAWFMMHPRVGGNAQDLMVRTISAAIGAVWGGLAFVSSKGNPFIMAIFAAVYMLPALYRFTTSSHPRSGLMACLSFSVISLSAYNTHNEFSSATRLAWTYGTAMVVGICAAVVVNWCIWPFVARHELRKALSAMMLNLAITYSGIVTRYIYPDERLKEDNERPDILDAKLREMFVRIRELLEMTTHEIRLRAPFNPTPYNTLIDTLERFFEHLVQVRQSSLYFQPNAAADTEEQTRSLLSCRRDAVASIIMNLYTIAAALRVQKPIPKYLPSAAVSRKRLLDQMEESELDAEEMRIQKITGQDTENHRRWADVYQFAYSSALTDIVGLLEELEALTKEICGEMALEVTEL